MSNYLLPVLSGDAKHLPSDKEGGVYVSPDVITVTDNDSNNAEVRDDGLYASVGGVMTDIFVSSVAGSDITGDGTVENPYRTLTHALTQIPDGGRATVWLFAFISTSANYSRYLLPSAEFSVAHITIDSWCGYAWRKYYRGEWTEDEANSWLGDVYAQQLSTVNITISSFSLFYYAKDYYEQFGEYMGEYDLFIGNTETIYTPYLTGVLQDANNNVQEHTGIISHGGSVTYRHVCLATFLYCYTSTGSDGQVNEYFGTSLNSKQKTNYQAALDNDSMRFCGVFDAELKAPMQLNIYACILYTWIAPLIRPPVSGAQLTVSMYGIALEHSDYSPELALNKYIQCREGLYPVPMKLSMSVTGGAWIDTNDSSQHTGCDDSKIISSSILGQCYSYYSLVDDTYVFWNKTDDYQRNYGYFVNVKSDMGYKHGDHPVSVKTAYAYPYIDGACMAVSVYGFDEGAEHWSEQ